MQLTASSKRSDIPESGKTFVSLLRIITLHAFLWPVLVALASYFFYRAEERSLFLFVSVPALATVISFVIVVFLSNRIVVPLRDLTFAIRDRRTDVLERIARRSSLLELHRMIASFSGYLASEEESRRRLAGALQEKTVVLEETRAGLRHTERLSSVGRMVAGIAHEINNPASYVAANLEVLRDYLETLTSRLDVFDKIITQAGNDSCSPEVLSEILGCLDDSDGEYEYRFAIDDLPNLIHAMGEGMERISSIIQSLRLFTHREVPRRELVDVRKALHSAIGILRSRFDESMELEVLCDHPVGVFVGPGQMEQIILNLLSNAIDAQPSGGLIQIEIHDRDDDSVITLADGGSGIPDEELERIFEPFYTTKSVRTNSGLGLAVVNEIVHRNSGSVSISSRVGEGTTVTVRLPSEPFPLEEIE